MQYLLLKQLFAQIRMTNKMPNLSCRQLKHSKNSTNQIYVQSYMGRKTVENI